MSILIKGMPMPKNCEECPFTDSIWCGRTGQRIHSTMLDRLPDCPLIELPPHGDLIDRDALMKDGWLSLWKRVDYMGGYAIHDLPLINPSIPVVIEKEKEDG